MAAQNDFFTWQTLATFSGTTLATTAITNAVCRVVPRFRHPAPLGLAVSLFLCLVTAVIDPESGNLDFARPFATYFIAVLNGIFVFASAAGISSGATAATGGGSSRRATRRGPGEVDSLGKPREVPLEAERSFWRNWF
jgi:hypothetical protein